MDYRVEYYRQFMVIFQEVRILPVGFSGNVLYIKDVSLLSLLIEILQMLMQFPSSTFITLDITGPYW